MVPAVGLALVPVNSLETIVEASTFTDGGNLTLLIH